MSKKDSKNTQPRTLQSVRVRLIDALQKVVNENKAGEDIYIGTYNGTWDYELSSYDVEELVDAIIEKDNAL